jgi:hypothetical protein
LRTAPSLTEAIIDGIFCHVDQIEYELFPDSDPLLFDLNHSVLLSNQKEIGWEQFIKGFISKDWRYIQTSYYSYLKLDRRKFNSEKWVGCLLQSLHRFRTDLWMIRNSALHGGFSKDASSTLRARLLRDVHYLYSKDRSCLSLADRQLFNLPRAYRLKQGNHQLLLWTKRAHMTFDLYDDEVKGPQQTQITDWLRSWDPNSGCTESTELLHNTDDTFSIDSDSRLNYDSVQKSRLAGDTLPSDQTSTAHIYLDCDDSSCSNSETHFQNKLNMTKKNNTVTDGAHQYLTPVTRSC